MNKYILSIYIYIINNKNISSKTCEYRNSNEFNNVMAIGIAMLFPSFP